MTRRSLAAVLLLLACGLHAQTLGPVDWIFVVDTSKSMRGVGGTKDIWTDVKVGLNTFIQDAGPADTFALYAFDRDVREIETRTPDDLYRVIIALAADGNRTHLGAAIAAGLTRAESLRAASSDRTRRQVVVLFTDGKEDIRGIKDAIAINANLDRVGSSFIFFVSMGEHEPQLQGFAAATKQATMLDAPTADSIRNIARKVRAEIPAAPEAARPPSPPVAPKPPPAAPALPPSSPWPKLAIALALIAAAAFFILQQQRKKNSLEGELEVLRPDAAYVGLPSLRANEVALSSILPLSVLGGSDARLFVRRKDGRKKVWIAAQSGSLRVNDVETPMSELYDADTIDIGDARLRFNRVGDERPNEFTQEGDL